MTFLLWITAWAILAPALYFTGYAFAALTHRWRGLLATAAQHLPGKPSPGKPVCAPSTPGAASSRVHTAPPPAATARAVRRAIKRTGCLPCCVPTATRESGRTPQLLRDAKAGLAGHAGQRVRPRQIRLFSLPPVSPRTINCAARLWPN